MALTDRVGDIRHIVRGQMRPQCGQIRDCVCSVHGGEPGGFGEGEALLELPRCCFQNSVAVRARHRDDQIGSGSDLGLELPRREIGCIAAQFLKDDGRIRVNRVPPHRAGSCARRCEVDDPVVSSVGGGESLRGRGAADVSGADEKDVHDLNTVCRSQQSKSYQGRRDHSLRRQTWAAGNSRLDMYPGSR